MGTFFLDWLVDLLMPADRQKTPSDLLKLAALIGAAPIIAVFVFKE